MIRPFRSFVVPWGAFALGCLAAAGCEPRTATVSGVVTYRGKPVPSGSVVLYCSDKQIVRGLIGADGRYAIPNVPLGAVPAVVTVQAHVKVPEGFRLKQQLPPSVGGPIPPVDDGANADRVALPARYALPEESGLSVVVRDVQVTFDIDLKP